MSVNQGYRILLIALATYLLIACANQEAPPVLTEITVSNTGTFPMNSPMACYYGDKDPKQCRIIDADAKTIEPGSSYNFFIKADQRVRLVFPFDTLLRSSGVMYRPNCHILVDFYAYKEKRYHANAAILAQRSDPEQGFNCDIQVFEQALGSSGKTLMEDNAVSRIRYRIPREGELPDDYISNYHWQ